MYSVYFIAVGGYEYKLPFGFKFTEQLNIFLRDKQLRLQLCYIHVRVYYVKCE